MNPTVFFANLSHATPNLKTLDVSMNRKNIENIKFPIAEYRNAVISYSQKLERLLLLETSHAAILECLSPFRAENFDPQASPVLSWPNLTNLDIIMCHDDQDGYIGRMKQSFSLVGRAVRQMPVIQNLQMVVTFDWTTSVGQRGEDSMLFTLSVFWDDVLNGSRANLSISPDLLSCDSSFPFVVARDVASEDVKELWRESLLNGAKAVLKVHVETEDALDEDALDEDALDEDDPDDDDQDEGVLDGDNLDEGDSNEDDYT